MDDRFEQLLAGAERAAASTTGWDFSYVNGRRHLDGAPWDWPVTIAEHLHGVARMLDMDTGGGEVLLRVREAAPAWPGVVRASEGHVPNIAVASARLAAVGVEVVECDAPDRLPFPDHSFDLIINRHGGYVIPEIRRLLEPGGTFVTQQIEYSNRVSLSHLLSGPGPAYDRADPDVIAERFTDAGFEIVNLQRFQGNDTYDDIGALAFVLLMAPWEVPGFSVDRYREPLRALHQRIVSEGPLDIGVGYWLLTVRKQAGFSATNR